MAIRVEIILDWEPTEPVLENLVADLGSVILDWGFGNDKDSEDVSSLIVVNDFDLDSEEAYEEYLEEKVEAGSFIALPLNAEEDVDN